MHLPRRSNKRRTWSQCPDILLCFSPKVGGEAQTLRAAGVPQRTQVHARRSQRRNCPARKRHGTTKKVRIPHKISFHGILKSHCVDDHFHRGKKIIGSRGPIYIFIYYFTPFHDLEINLQRIDS